jgi:hypothetical protein
MTIFLQNNIFEAQSWQLFCQSFGQKCGATFEVKYIRWKSNTSKVDIDSENVKNVENIEFFLPSLH